MAAKDIKIFLKTVADVTGISRLGAFLKRHVSALGVVKAAYRSLKAVGGAALDALGAAWRKARQAALGLTAAMAASVREFYVWNKEASRAWTMMDVGVAGFVKLRKEISRLSPELGVAKSELGKGWYQALSAGVDENNLIDFLRTAAKVAVADGSTIESAIDGITTVLNSYGLESAKATEVTDMMFKTVRYGKTSFADLAAYISQAAPAASAMGVGIDQVLAATATLTKQGVPTSTAMIQIRNAILGLNKAMGDGWAKTMTLQDGLEQFARESGYSATALQQAFGRGNVAGVMAMVGDNAKNAAEDLARMRTEGGGLDDAFGKVDSQIGHWPRIWQSVRAAVSDVGEAVDTALKPSINWIAGQLNKMRDSAGFNAFIEKLGASVKSLVEAAVAGVKTVVDMISKASVGGLISGAVNSLVDLAITLIAEGLRSLGTVMVALAKVFSAALAADVMKMDLPFRNELKEARRAAMMKLPLMDEDEAAGYGIEPADLAAMRNKDDKRTAYRTAKRASETLSLDQAVKVATSGKDQDINAAVTRAFESFAASRDRLGSAGDRVLNTMSDRTGLDVRALYAQNVREINAAMGAPAGAPAAKQGGKSPSLAGTYTQTLGGTAPGAGTDAEKHLAAQVDKLQKQLEVTTAAEGEAFTSVIHALKQMKAQANTLKTVVTNLPNT